MNMRTPIAALSTLALALALTACGDDDAATGPDSPSGTISDDLDPTGQAVDTDVEAEVEAEAAAGPPRVADTVATGLKAPWGLAYLPNGSALVAERDTAMIRRISPSGRVRTVGKVPGVVPGGEGGLLGLAVAPNYKSTKDVYAYFTGANDNRVVRMTYSGDGLGTPRVVLAGIAKASIHNGGRMTFGPDGMLYVGTGDAGVTSRSQERNSLNGKILRITKTGKVPSDNPRSGSLVFSLGHRNVQGLAFDSRGRLWAAEFGQNTFDELNLIKAGRNYGWPMVEGKGSRAGFTNPERVWSTDEASPSGIAFWKGSIWMAGLRGSRLWQIPLTASGAPTATPKAHFTDEYGRLRTVAQAPDGSLWLITSNTDGRGRVRSGDDRVLRIVRS
ncbi:MAG: PQQ-dependent sugar dehydrogenase [Sporichthyaceae bacterium]